MTKKKVKPVKKYEVVRGIESDVHGWRFEAGAIVTEKDIEQGLIDGWLSTGVLKES